MKLPIENLHAPVVLRPFLYGVSLHVPALDMQKLDATGLEGSGD